MNNVQPAAPAEAEPAAELTVSHWLRIVLWGGAAACLLAAGLLMWDARGDAVFTDIVSAALAWCF